jgi:hypothetical protein
MPRPDKDDDPANPQTVPVPTGPQPLPPEPAQVPVPLAGPVWEGGDPGEGVSGPEFPETLKTEPKPIKEVQEHQPKEEPSKYAKKPKPLI